MAEGKIRKQALVCFPFVNPTYRAAIALFSVKYARCLSETQLQLMDLRMLGFAKSQNS
jgi:hypothetical protein